MVRCDELAEGEQRLNDMRENTRLACVQTYLKYEVMIVGSLLPRWLQMVPVVQFGHSALYCAQARQGDF